MDTFLIGTEKSELMNLILDENRGFLKCVYRTKEAELTPCIKYF